MVTAKLAEIIRRLADLGMVLAALEGSDAAVCSAVESFDTSTPSGKLYAAVLRCMVQFEAESEALRLHAEP